MSEGIDISRRGLLQFSGLSTAALTVAPQWLLVAAEQAPQDRAGKFEPEVEITITAQVTGVPILPDITHVPDRMMGFLGDRVLVNGKPDFVLFLVRA